MRISEPQLVHAVRVSLGVGKSTLARKHAAATLRRMREAGDTRTIAMAVPTHALGQEQASAFDALPDAKAANLKSAVWRGRTAKDPTTSDKTMCRDPDAVSAAQEAGAEVESSCCKSGNGSDAIKCAFFDLCGYQAQKAQKADIWFVAHEMIFTEKPTAIGQLAILIIDEAPWSAGLEGMTGDGMTLNFDAIKHLQKNLPEELAGPDRQKVFFVLAGLHSALVEQGDGPLPADFLSDHALFRGDFVEARQLLFRAIVDPKMRPGMSIAQLKELGAAVALNKTVLRTLRLLKAVIALFDAPDTASGHAEVTFHNNARCVRLKGRRDVGKEWHVPTILMDANLDIELLRPYWPQIKLVAEIEAATPNMVLHQVIDCGAFGKSALDHEKRARNVRSAVLRQARKVGGRALIVSNKAFIDLWRKIGTIPPGVSLAHFNALAGRDCWQDVRFIAIIGRTMPSPADVERLAEALTGRAVERLPGWFSQRDGIAGGQLIEAVFHPDPIAERVRWAIAEGEVLQAIGRGRGANRTARNPLQVLVLGALPLGLPSEAVPWETLNPNWCDLALSETGIALRSPTDAAAAAPELWQDKDSARSYQRKSAEQVAIPLLDISIGKSPLVRFIYQKAGPKQHEAEGFADLDIVPDPKSWLEARLGPLAHFEDWSIQRLRGK